MKLLTSDSFEKARTFVMDQGRELERRLLSYYFDDGTPAAVLDELARSGPKTSVGPHQGSSSAFALSVFHRARRS